jgi:hypothetical protein
MIKQLRPPTFLITFTTSVNKWLSLSKTLKNLYVQHYGKNDDTFDKKKLVRNDLVTCVRYYAHKMNSFFKLLKYFDFFLVKSKVIFSSQNFNKEV